MKDQKAVPPAFPTVTIHTSDGDLTVPCEPVGEYLAITPGFQMYGDADGFQASLPGTFEVHLRKTGRPLTESGGCIVCARQYAKVLAESPIDWSTSDDEITTQAAALPDEIRIELARGRDLAFRCDSEWCDRTGPGVVLIPVN